MFLRTVKVKNRNGGYTRYAQLAESYRRADGMPANRVIANLGILSDLEIANFRASIKASKEGKAVVVPDVSNPQFEIIQNLAFLDVAVGLELWRSWHLSELLDGLIEDKGTAMSTSDVICALTMQRLVEPGSKLSAQRWYPQTALPELMGVKVANFHNTRVHRALEKLSKVEEKLQDKLGTKYLSQGAFSTLFMDVTDAYFEGRGSEMARKGKTKEGRYRYKVNILLLCNEKGYPVRWKTLPGDVQDGPAMRGIIDEIRGEEWAENVPIVFDRAMGTAKTIGYLWDKGVRFVTACKRPEIASYTDKMPSADLASVKIREVQG